MIKKLEKISLRLISFLMVIIRSPDPPVPRPRAQRSPPQWRRGCPWSPCRAPPGRPPSPAPRSRIETLITRRHFTSHRYTLQYLSASQNKSLSPSRGPQWLISSPGSNNKKLITTRYCNFPNSTCWLRSSICANIGPCSPPATGADTFLVTPGSKYDGQLSQ